MEEESNDKWEMGAVRKEEEKERHALLIPLCLY